MATQPSISDAEWEVMLVLWDRSPLTAGEVVDALKDRKEWNPRTIKTLLNRLVKKRAIDFTTQQNRYLYSPKIGKDACVRTKSRSFAARVFGGAAGPMLVQFVKQADLTAQDIEELTKVLKEKSQRDKSPSDKSHSDKSRQQEK